ncbi:Taurine-transporting ATPase [Desulfotomaculum nigrificans CO-1-SRB]|uniref:ABC-type quaternary amine transporter n=1 Tax=Desulfotomaculum nigrificans (strain DSM 14880 / VKM B-2319 / CO-1-SRB) TaxID=868595 RepID=F6B308_DESCC|nr:ABC transporter ATP-binding protein [Desulfotomaculum nigrificans]AEF93912.1 Taurine-transporting ATPase [Desulfotomaculum nigrificans CO-1-SRB]
MALAVKTEKVRGYEVCGPPGMEEETYIPPKIAVREVSKVYTSKNKSFTALENISLEIRENEFISIVGPSGCGKSTLLRMLAGLEMPTQGKIWVEGDEVRGPGADRGMVFQAYTLFPWLTVADNIAFGLKLKGVPEIRRREIVKKYLNLIGLDRFANSYPKELSGGMKQRVAIARALANNPSVLLMDEPFGALDPQTKATMQELLLDIWRQERSTVVFITHDIEEAIFLSRRVYVMQSGPGRIVAEFKIDLPEQRNNDIKDTEAFINLKRKIVALIRN